MCVLRLGLLKSSKTPEFSTFLAEWVAYGMANAVLRIIDNRLVRMLHYFYFQQDDFSSHSTETYNFETWNVPNVTVKHSSPQYKCKIGNN